uniref:DUF2089 domain-containing protein n=1 Tax=Fervidobacterium thailandense TaxID=1008305 RepID=A0A7C4RXU5_9BACT
MPMMLPRCPICGKPMVVKELRCEEHDVTVRGTFEVPPYIFLDEEDTKFVLMFLRARGNLKEIERLTGIGYFALRGKLERLLEKMGLTPIDTDEESSEADAFRLLKEKKITVEEAIALLKKRRGGEEDGRAAK